MSLVFYTLGTLTLGHNYSFSVAPSTRFMKLARYDLINFTFNYIIHWSYTMKCKSGASMKNERKTTKNTDIQLFQDHLLKRMFILHWIAVATLSHFTQTYVCLNFHIFYLVYRFMCIFLWQYHTVLISEFKIHLKIVISVPYFFFFPKIPVFSYKF